MKIMVDIDTRPVHLAVYAGIWEYSDEPLNGFKIVTDFLPTPKKLVAKQQNTKITISLSSESVEFFKQTAKKHQVQYQRIICELLDEYVAQQKDANKAH